MGPMVSFQMSEEQAPVAGKTLEESQTPGFFKRYRLPLLLAVVAFCLYAGSIVYILFGRGQVA